MSGGEAVAVRGFYEGDGTSDFTRPDPVYWRRLERGLLDLQRLGIRGAARVARLAETSLSRIACVQRAGAYTIGCVRRLNGHNLLSRQESAGVVGRASAAMPTIC